MMLGQRCSACRGRAGNWRVTNKTMPVSSAHQIVLCAGQRRLLLARARRASGEHRDVLRARIVLAAGGASNAAIARSVGVTDDTVRKWRRRFCQHGLDGLADRSRPGRPRRFAATVVAEVKALACELPADTGTPLARWSCPELAAEAISRRIVTSSHRCRRRRCAVGWPATRSSRGSTARGSSRATRTSSSRPLAPWICTRGCSTENR